MPLIQRLLITLAATGLLALASAPARAQTGTIAGRVTNAQTLQPLAGTQVSIPGRDVGTLAQPDGRFILVNVPAGAHEVTVQRIGYRTVTQTVTVAAGRAVTVNFAMTEEALALDEVIVTGTPGGTRRRAIGNAVTRVDAAEVAAVRPVQTMQNMLQGRSPGVSFTRSSGNIGEGSVIRIRGVSSFGLGTQPLIYIDGIRMDNSTTLGPKVPNLAKSSSASALDDLNPNDIESIEIIKGPAAATLYGTEASAGVIQIITKKGQSGAPQFEVGMTQGTNFLMDAEEMIGDQWYCTARARPCPEQNLKRFNILEAERARGNEPLGRGLNQRYNVSVRGGTDAVNYFVSTEFSDQTGIVDYNWSKRFSGRANLGVLVSEELTLNLSMGYTNGDTRFASGSLEGGGLWPHLMWASGRDLEGEQRGFLSVRPEEFALIETTRDNTRFTGSATLAHNPFSWLQQRLVVGVDRGDEENQTLFPRDAKGMQGPFGSKSRGEVTLERPINTEYTIDYSASAKYALSPAFGLTSSVGLQYFSSELNRVETIGRVFPATAIRSLEGATETTATQAFLQNKSLGIFVQQEVGWNDRVFLTAAVRGDDNSAFGAEYDAAIYPKLSATWVLSEEPFWNADRFGSLRLRSAWGKAGRQPGTFDAVTLFGPAVGSGGAPAVTPRALGNPELGPEVSTELEVGFDAGFFNDRLSTEFTYFSQQIDDALLTLPLSPTSGFPGSESANVGQLDNWGYELSLNARPVEQAAWSLDLGFSLAYSMNEIKNLGGRQPTDEFRLGVPYPNRATDIIVGTQVDAAGRTTFLCDAGVSLAPSEELRGKYGFRMGGPTVPCSETRNYEILLGPTFSPWTWSTDATLTVLGNLQLFGMIDAEHGRWINDFNVSCRLAYCQFPNAKPTLTRADPIQVESDLFWSRHPTDSRYAFESDASYIRLREVGARYTLPEALLFGADRASISIAGRNLWYLWKAQETMKDGITRIPSPEASDPTSETGFALFQWPPLTSFELALRVSF